MEWFKQLVTLLAYYSLFGMGTSESMQAVVVDETTRQLSLSDTISVPDIESNQVLIKVHSAGINRADLMQAAGRYPPPKGVTTILGLEVSGTIVEIDDSLSMETCEDTSDHEETDCNDRSNYGLQIGDSVIALVPGGAYAEYVAVDASTVIKIDDSDINSKIDMTTLGGIPEVFMTAYQLLFWHGFGFINIENDKILKEMFTSEDKNKIILIHAGGSGVGTTLIQYLHWLGFKNIIVTAGSQWKIDKAIELGAKYGINYKNYKTYKNSGNMTNSWSDEILKWYPNGVDLIFDCVGADYWFEHTKVIAQDGIWVLYGLMSGHSIDTNLNQNNPVSMAPFISKRVTFKGTTLRSRDLKYKGQLTKDVKNNILPLIMNGEIKLILSKVFPFQQCQMAHDFVRNNSNFGKVILTWHADD